MRRKVQRSRFGRDLNDQTSTLFWFIIGIISYLPYFELKALGLLPVFPRFKRTTVGSPVPTQRSIGRDKDFPGSHLPILKIRLVEDTGFADPYAAHNKGAPNPEDLAQ